MKNIFVFPGQGSQFVGMGEELFPRYQAEVDIADKVLGYSIEELCLVDANGRLNQTEFTQPALFFVNAIHYLHEKKLASSNDVRNKINVLPNIFAGHSLGEYCALFAAGAFDLATGLALVKKRGELMSSAPKGTMAAVMDIHQKDVARILCDYDLESIDIANINSRGQTIISGLIDDIGKAAEIFEKNNARYIPLNVSAAFHSRYMSSVAQEFSDFLTGFELQPLSDIVISNLTAEPYPKENYQSFLIKQIDHSVRWYESISNVLANGVKDIVEIGPGMVLTRMCGSIVADPLEVNPSPLIFSAQIVEKDNPQIDSGSFDTEREIINKKSANYLMFAGQGSQYFGMGAELYRENKIFRVAMDECDEILIGILGYSIVDEIYQLDANQAFDFIRSSHPAVVSFGYSLFRVIQDAEVIIDGVIGHSLGEYIAAVAAEAISLKHCLEMVCVQAELLEKTTSQGSLISVLTDQGFLKVNAELFHDVELAAKNSPKNFMFSGSKQAIRELSNTLAKLDVTAVILSVDYAFHSHQIDNIKEAFFQACKHVKFSPAKIPLLSGHKQKASKNYSLKSLWQAVREPVEFQNLVQSSLLEESTLIDLSATGSLSGFIRQCPQANVKHTHVVNQFGNNLTTLNAALKMIA